MAYEGWIEYGGDELVNLSRAAQLVRTLGIDIVRLPVSRYQWIEDALGGTGYDDVTTAPWYDADYPASAEFAGLVPLAVSGLEDSTLQATTVEYITDGGNSGKSRSGTLSMVASMVLVGSTTRGVEFGKRWMDKVLRRRAEQTFCAGSTLRYFSHPQDDGEPVPDIVHRRSVRLTRGATITRKRAGQCAVAWWTTFTWTADDPFEYGEPVLRAEELGSGVAEPDWISSGSDALTQATCPSFNYSPIYDPLYPALVPAPTAPAFYPDGWTIAEGDTFQRWWAQVDSISPEVLNVVPVITIRTTEDTRMVRVSVWAEADGDDTQCDPLFSAVVTYIPANLDFIIDGEQKASYTWDGVSPGVRRADSLVYSPDANPVEWTAFNDADSFFVTLDVFEVGSDVPASGDVTARFEFVPKSD